LHLHPVKVRRHGVKITYTYCMGGISFLLFLILVVTGVLLMFYYHPSVDVAYGDMKDLETGVNLGMLMRNLHRWAGHGMVITVFLHMIRVFATGSYRPPREFNWVVGVVLLFLTFLLSFTGYLLPWDQLSFWAITVGTNMAGYAPVIGADMRFLLLGAFDVGANALIRFYTLHVILIPLVAGVLMAVHFWRIRKDGGISGPL
ncbi:MAG: cytochrome b N-terminal domain-containing protein, partial [Dehalococcoidia bacterium]|nr:cytochrome b N-terminal domain-containing protein [Dehalococcoidia bacterium]